MEASFRPCARSRPKSVEARASASSRRLKASTRCFLSGLERGRAAEHALRHGQDVPQSVVQLTQGEAAAPGPFLGGHVQHHDGETRRVATSGSEPAKTHLPDPWTLLLRLLRQLE